MYKDSCIKEARDGSKCGVAYYLTIFFVGHLLYGFGGFMESSYYKNAKNCVVSTLRGNRCTFEELCRKCHGLYPTVIRNIISELKIHETLIPVYTTDQNSIPLDAFDDRYYESHDNVTEQIQNNPILSSWYFSWNTCGKIASIDIWKNKSVLFLGTPRLFEYFITRNYGKELTLIDLDELVVSSLRKKYCDSAHKSLFFCCKNITTINIEELNSQIPRVYDYVFLDPPWYLESYGAWLDVALKFTHSSSSIVFSLFPSLLRPSAMVERKDILDRCRDVATKVQLFPDYLEYDIPSFEKGELVMEGLLLRSSWKMADMVVLTTPKGNSYKRHSFSAEEYSMWREFNFFDYRWFFNQSFSTNDDLPVVSAPLGTLYLKSPSKRNPEFGRVNLLSSRGHGLLVSNSLLFFKAISEIQSQTSKDAICKIIQDLDIDDESKHIFYKLMEER